VADHRVIVDLDGTLLDTRRRHHTVYLHALRSVGGEQAPLTLPAFWRAKRRGRGWPRLLGDRVATERFLDAWKTRIEAPDMLALDSLQPGAARALQRLRQAGFELVLLTARHDGDALAAQLRALAIDTAFRHIIAVGQDAKTPPPGAPALHWFGDTEADVTAARAANIPVTLVTNGIRAPSLLMGCRADALAPSFGAAVTRFLKQ